MDCAYNTVSKWAEPAGSGRPARGPEEGLAQGNDQFLSTYCVCAWSSGSLICSAEASTDQSYYVPSFYEEMDVRRTKKSADDDTDGKQ